MLYDVGIHSFHRRRSLPAGIWERAGKLTCWDSKIMFYNGITMIPALLLLKPQLRSGMCLRHCWSLSRDAYAMSHAAAEGLHTAAGCRAWWRVSACSNNSCCDSSVACSYRRAEHWTTGLALVRITDRQLRDFQHDVRNVGNIVRGKCTLRMYNKYTTIRAVDDVITCAR